MIINNIISLSFITSIFISSIFAETLTGTVKYDGKPMPKKPSTQLKKLTDDPVCGSKHKTPVYRQSVIVNDNKTLKNVLVYFKDIKYEEDPTETPATLDQNGCLYSPHVLGVMANQQVIIRNSDANVLHNVHSLAKKNMQFNAAMPIIMDLPVTFTEIESPFVIKCDVHAWMKAYVSVFNHPYFSVTDDSGRYQIDNVPPGTYEVDAWHERDLKRKGYTETKTVEIVEDGATLDFSLSKGKKKK